MNANATIQYTNSSMGAVNTRTREMIIEPAKDTPFIKYSEPENILMIKGSSMRMDMHHFYYPVLSKVWDHLENNRSFRFYFFFKEINATTAKVLFDIFKRIKLKNQNGSDIEVYWGAEIGSEGILETGKDFAELYDLNFQYVLKS